MKFCFILIRIIFLALVISGCSLRKGVPVGQVPAATLPTAVEKSEANAFVDAHVDEEGYKYVERGNDLKRVRGIVNRLEVAAGYSAGTFPLYLVDAGDEVNAMAVNSATIVVYQKLLERVRSDDELSVVLAHEIAHILCRHSQEEAENDTSSTVDVASSILGTAASVATSLAGYGGVSDIAGSVTEGTTSLIGYGAFVRKFDREQEYEADHVGLMVMARAGYNPAAAVAFWDRAGEVFGVESDSSQVMAFFSTHPANRDRRASLEAALPFAQPVYDQAIASRAAVPAKKGTAKKK